MRNPRLIVLFLLIVAPISPARGDDSLLDLAQRFTAASESPQGMATSAAMSDASQPATESQPLGPTEAAASRFVNRNAPGASPISTGSWVMDTLTALGVVIALILAARWAYAKFGGRAATSSVTPAVEVLARTSVAPRNHVLLLRVGSRILVVSDSAGGMRTLSDIDDPEEVASLIGAVSVTRDNSITRNFSRLFQNFNGQYDRTQPAEEGGDDGEHTVDRARDSLSGLLSRVRLMSGRGGAG